MLHRRSEYGGIENREVRYTEPEMPISELKERLQTINFSRHEQDKLRLMKDKTVLG